MPALADLVQPTEALLEVQEGVSVTMMFDRNKTSSYWSEAVQAGIRAGDNFSIAEAIAGVALSWDLYDKAPGDYPPTKENLAALSLATQSELFAAIMENAVPSRAEGNVSESTSATAETISTPLPANPQNGQPLSSLPTPSASLSPT
jgi:hypothetical protein